MQADIQSEEAHRELLAHHGGSAAAAFSALAGACVRRFLAQNDRAEPPPDVLAGYTNRLWQVANEAGLPGPLAFDESGVPIEMPPERVAALMQSVWTMPELAKWQADLDTVTRQLLKACLHPEFRQCRESYHEVVDGACRRQTLSRVRERLSGSHCVDCPYWVALRHDQNRALLEKAWVGGDTDALRCHDEVFLPQDFRRLRIFLWWHARLP
jgi:hypothetical protein